MCYWFSNYEIQQAVHYSNEYWHKLHRHDRKAKSENTLHLSDWQIVISVSTRAEKSSGLYFLLFPRVNRGDVTARQTHEKTVLR